MKRTTDSSRRVVSGGFDYGLEPTVLPQPALVFSSRRDSKRAWEVEAIDELAKTTLTAYAYCEKKKK